jgi:hypothetical protein
MSANFCRDNLQAGSLAEAKAPGAMEEKTRMKQLVKFILGGALGVLAAAGLAWSVQVQPGASESGVGAGINTVWAQEVLAGQRQLPGEYVLAGAAEPKAVKPAPPAAPEAPKAKRMRKMGEPPSPAMERDSSKSMEMGDDLERVGTKKLGGQTIRAKED